MGLVLVPYLDERRLELLKIPNLGALKINFSLSAYIKTTETEASMRIS